MGSALFQERCSYLLPVISFLGRLAAVSASTSARAIAREQLTQTILASARAQLGTVGPAQLSVRAVARDIGMVSSAVYRYFPSRDELLTELLIICYDELGAEVEAAEMAIDRADVLGRWLAIAHALRRWALAHPFDYALLYGSPVPGYAAPRRTVDPASRVPRLVVALLAGISDPGDEPVDGKLHRALAGIRDFAGMDLSDELLMRGLQSWSGLIGAISLELFGHLANGVDDYDTYFAAMAGRLAPV
jgi:AcrR family transcriptional regulator